MVRAATADALAADLAAEFAGSAAPGPLDRCVVAVQGPGLGRWLRGEMAQRLGAWGGVDTPFLRGFLLELACQGTQDLPPRGREDLDELTFRIAAVLSDAARDHGSLPASVVRPVLAMVQTRGATIDHAGLLRVSRRLADAFDRYQVDRPELVTAWQRDASGLPTSAAAHLRELEAWQRPLWRATAANTNTHRAWSRLRDLVTALHQGPPPITLRLPAFVSVFGVSLLSPFLLQVLQALARHTRVTLHMLTPTQAFVAERSTRRQLLWDAAEAGMSEADTANALHMQPGHPLLDAMGRQASHAQRVLLDLNVELDDESTHAPPAATMLARLQRDLLLDQPPEPGIGEVDASIQVHAVTTPHRAAEVAHEAVLAAMSDMPGLRPERVAILTPDIVGAGNAIESVFAQHGQLPLTAADKQLARASSLAVAMRHVIAAVSEGLTMACLQAVLGQPSVLAKLRLRCEGLARWLDRLEEAGARRFLDQFDRAARLERDRVADDRIHTLQWAVDRVVLGLAMQTAVDPLDMAERAEPLACVDEDLLPAPASGSAGLEELHQVVRAIEAVADFVRAASTARPLAEWCDLLLKLAEHVLPAVEHADFGRERRQLNEGLQRLAQAAQRGGFVEPLDFASAREQLEAAIADTREGTHFASGGITLARLAPMRSVPFDVLVLVGLEPGAFPRSRHADGLDLISAAPRAGDQIARQEDLQLFLECVHAAHKRLVIIHCGVDPRTADRRPPSPVVDQLLDACAAEAADRAGAKRLRAALVTVHPQRADQPEAWTKPFAQGFDVQARQSAEAAERGRKQPMVHDLFDGAQVEPRMPESMHAWMKALRDPAEALLERLGLRVPDTEGLLAESDELVQTDPLQDWKRRESCVRAMFRGVEGAVWMRAVRLHGWLPHGQIGAAIAQASLDEALEARGAVTALAVKQGWLGAEPARTICTDHMLQVRAQAFAVQVERLADAPVQVLWYPAGKKHHLIALWMRHLVWSVITPGSHSIVMPLGQKTPKFYAALDPGKAMQRLERLMEFAVAATCVPLPIEPKMVMAWDPEKPPEERIRKVQEALHGAFKARGVMQDAANGLVFAREPWGAGTTLAVQGATVPTGLDDIAAEIKQAMKEDGWPTK